MAETARQRLCLVYLNRKEAIRYRRSLAKN